MICCYYPTNIVVIDDDQNFLNSLKIHFSENCILYNSPLDALSRLKKQSQFERIKKRLQKSGLFQDENLPNETLNLTINLKKLHEEIYSQDRFNDVSVVIVDYYMEEMSGIDLCQKLDKFPAKKILLTGGKDKEKVAIDAFNQGVIDRFINKHDPNFPTLLEQTIKVLKSSYFQELTKYLLADLSIVNPYLQHPCYNNFVHQIKEKLQPNEFYLLDMAGSFLLFDSQGLPYWLIIKTDKELNGYVEIASDNGNKKISQLLATHKCFPFFFTEDDLEKGSDSWGEYLYKAEKVPGLTNHYYTLIEGHIRNNLNRDAIISNNYNHTNHSHEYSISSLS